MSDNPWDVFKDRDGLTSDGMPYDVSPDQVVVRRFVMAETDSYNDMMIRPFEANMTGDKINMLRSVTQDFDVTEVTNLSTVAGSILQPSFQARSIAAVDNGWSTPRLRFLMEVEYVNAGIKTIQLLTGWTDRADISLGGHIADDTLFFISNSTVLRQIPMPDAYGGTRTNTRVQYTSQLLRENAKPGLWNRESVERAEGAHSLRPEDIFTQCSTRDLVKELNDTVHNDPYYGEDPFRHNNTFHDPRTHFNRLTPIKLTRRMDSTATGYLTSTFKTFRTAVNTAQDYSTADDVYSRAITCSEETLLCKHPFFSILNRDTSFATTSAFKLRELLEVAPSARRLIKETPIIRRGSLNLIGTGRGNTTSWSEATKETMVATIIMNAMPAIAMDTTVAKIMLTMTNDTLNGQTVVECLNTTENPPRLFTTDQQARRCVVKFMDCCRIVVMRDIINAVQEVVAVTVRLDMNGDTFISVSINGGPRMDYIAPTFMDGLFTTQLSNRRIDLDALTDTFQDVFENNFGHYDDSSSNY